MLREVLEVKVQGNKIKDMISIRLHLFSLPFHHNSFLASIALKFMEQKYPNKFIDFLQLQLNSIEKYTTRSISESE